jgi:LuxR family maltose regulon positive regulatory protein
VTQLLGQLYNSALRILLARTSARPDRSLLEAGVRLAQAVLAAELRCRHLPIAMQTLLLRSRLHSALGEASLSLEDLAQAVRLGRPEGFISPFTEEGPVLAPGLRRLLDSGTLDEQACVYVNAILAGLPAARAARAQGGSQRGDDSLVEPLTPREMEVLGLIALGDSNQEIARKLVITVSAVKKHTVNIFHKLNVNSRTQALARARRLGLLAPGI